MGINSWTEWPKKASICAASTMAARQNVPKIFFNLSAEWWSTVGQLIERRQIILPNCEKLISQLTSRRKLYDSKGREWLRT